MAVVLISPPGTSSPWVSEEWSAILQHTWEHPGFIVFPVLLKDVELPSFLRDWHTISVRADTQAEVLSALIPHLPAAERQAVLSEALATARAINNAARAEEIAHQVVEAAYGTAGPEAWQREPSQKELEEVQERFRTLWDAALQQTSEEGLLYCSPLRHGTSEQSTLWLTSKEVSRETTHMGRQSQREDRARRSAG